MKLVQYPVLMMALLVLCIGFLQNLMDPLEDVLNPLNEYGGFFGLGLNMGRFYPMWLQEVVQHQWDPSVGILVPLEMGHR
jgi:hypothetical protein